MKKERNCSRCYIEIKRLRPIRGIFLTTIFTIMLMIPVLSLSICHFFFKEGRKKESDRGYMRDFWDSCFYDYVQKRVKYS